MSENNVTFTLPALLSLIESVLTVHLGSAAEWCAGCGWRPDDTEPGWESWRDWTEGEIIRKHQLEVLENLFTP